MSRFQFCLNTSTIRSEGASVLDAIDTAADAGFDGLEPWVNELDQWVENGGSLEEIKDRAESRGIQIVNLIAFPEWAVPEDDCRAKGLEEAERCLKMAHALGCPYLAAPPFGIHDRKVDLYQVAERFAVLVDLAAEYGVTPLLEFWGIAKTLGTTGEALFVAAECGRSGVQLLADVYHMYKGSDHYFGFEHFGAGRLGLVHVNDYPEIPGRDSLTDADRVYPGDGLAPWDRIVGSLNAIQYEGMLSLELFNQSYWDQGPDTAAREGLEKLRKCVGLTNPVNTPSPASLVAPECPVLADEVAEYRKRNSKSDALYQEARQFLAGGNSRLTAFFRPFPFYVKRGDGYLLYDVDGNSRIDFYNNASSLILGHAHPAITATLTDQAVRGTAFTHPTRPEIDLAELLVEEIPSLDQLRFTNSGTEAVAMAIRAARSFTGKSKIAKMEGAYHGTSDLMSVSETTDLAHAGPADSPLAVPSSAGLTASTLAEVVVVPFNDCDAAKQIIESHRDDLAAVIVEPAMANIGYVSATPEFLGTLRKACDGTHTLLIFDEVQTLRLGTGGLQALVGVIPDLTSLGKIIGGGLPVGAFGGRADIMEAFDGVAGHPRIPHGGTFNANPMTMQAGLAALHKLNEAVYARLNDLGESLRERLASEATERNVPLQVTGIGSFFGIHFIENPVVDYRSARKQNAALRERLFFFLLNRGIFLRNQLVGNISTPMGQDQLDRFVEAWREFLETVS